MQLNYNHIFFISAFLFVVFIGAFAQYGSLSYVTSVFGALIAISFLAVASLRMLAASGSMAINSKRSKPIMAAFSALVLFFTLSIAIMPSARISAMLSLLQVLILLAKYIVLMLPILFCIMFGVYLFRAGRKYWAFAMLLIFAAVVIVSLYYFAEYVFHLYPDDEAYICFLSAKALLNGTNPYAVSFSSQVYANMRNMSYTLTTSNNIIGTINYPVLYLLSFIPFYLLLPPSMANLSTEMNIQAGVFILLLFITIAIVLDKKYVGKPQYSVIIFLLFSLAIVSSTQTFLMLALILLAYAKIDSRYSWILLGLAASIQEELWLPVLFLIIYSFANKGLKRGIYDLLGTLLVFALINGYFIAINPSAYLDDVFSPIGKLILPLPSSFFGYPLLQLYTIPIPSLTVMFGITTLLMMVLFFFFNEKKLVPIFSMVPLMFPHALGSYYTFFISFAVIAIFIADKKATRRKTFLSKHKRITIAIIALLIASGFYVIISAHASYQNSFNIAIKNQSLISNSSAKAAYYSANINYGKMANRAVYLFLYGYSNTSIYIFGLGNSSIISNPQHCSSSDYQCLINVNKIEFPNSTATYILNATLLWPTTGNSTSRLQTPIRAVTAILYNGNYIYIANMTPASR